MFARLSLILLAISLLSGRAHAEFGVVSSASPEATAAGVEVLEAGGNAIDAAVAVQFALAVTEPAMSGLGGGTQIILKKPGEAPIVINGTTFAPGAIPESATKKQVQTGRTASTIPSTVRVFDFAYRQYGSGNVAWDALLAPAIRYAEEGWVVGPFRARVYRRHEEDLRGDLTLAKLFLMDGRYAPREGDLVKMPVLGGTLRRLAEEGGMDFYTGEVAKEIAADMAKHGGWITEKDLAAFPEPVVASALTTTYRGYGVYTLLPPAGGWAVLQALNILERESLERLNKEGDARSRALLRALRAAHSSRRNAPIGGGTLPGEAESVEIQISKQTAAALWKKSGGETTHFSIVDKDGMVVAVTTSINRYFGAWAASPKLGFLYNNYMAEFETDAPDHPFA
ncbi:MAG: gamma-glutamyltransferase, partial [Amphiplicatus sp.]